MIVLTYSPKNKTTSVIKINVCPSKCREETTYPYREFQLINIGRMRVENHHYENYSDGH